MTTLLPDLYFSYSQFFVYDKRLISPACEWTKAHSRQGFARREGAIAVGTILDFGRAKVRVGLQSLCHLESYQRVIAVPLTITSGKLAVDGPEEYPLERAFPLPAGSYRVVIAQRTIDDETEEVDIFIEHADQGFDHSEILVADDALDPPYPLIESAEAPS